MQIYTGNQFILRTFKSVCPVFEMSALPNNFLQTSCFLCSNFDNIILEVE